MRDVCFCILFSVTGSLGFMNAMVWLVLGLGLACALIAAWLRRDLIAPRCPICREVLEGGAPETVPLLSYHRWRIGWQMFYCTQCLYHRRLLSISREGEVADL